MSYFLKATLEGMLRPEEYREFGESPDAVLELLRGDMDERYPLPTAGEERLPPVFGILIADLAAGPPWHYVWSEWLMRSPLRGKA